LEERRAVCQMVDSGYTYRLYVQLKFMLCLSTPANDLSSYPSFTCPVIDNHNKEVLTYLNSEFDRILASPPPLTLKLLLWL
jgi:hypothetical protein